jgi:hypothetical protein
MAPQRQRSCNVIQPTPAFFHYTFSLQGYPELAGILSQKDIDELDADIDPVAMVSDKLTAEVRHCALGAPQTPAPIYSTLDSNIKTLNMDLGACQRILSDPPPPPSSYTHDCNGGQHAAIARVHRKG